ncbi:MAG: mechanosensitive ion channel [Deltaproteobacteria bacterium]|nr:mechanosensitive ion channel [Deltaproteobacteria bacterium]
MDQIGTRIQELITIYGLKIIAAIVILIVGCIVAKWIRSVFGRLLRKRNVDEILVSFVVSLTYWAIIAFVIIAALGQLGVQTASFIAVVGAAGLAIGLALQGSLANFAAGVLMIIFKPFKVGDYIEAGGTAGTVEGIGIFTTELKSPDNRKIIIPNAKVTSDCITNYSAKEERRVDIVAGVSYKDDLDKVRKVLEGILAEDDRILKEPAPTIGVVELGDSSVNFVVRPWVKTADYWNVYFATQEKIKKRFDAEGISIPFPQQDVYVHNA